MNRLVKVAIAEDQTMFRKGFINLLNHFGDIKVVAEASDGKELLTQMKNCKPDIAFIDFKMARMNGLDTTKAIRKKHPKTKVIMLSMYDDDGIIINSIESGASGYITKDEEPKEIKKAIDSVVDTGIYFNEKTSKALLNKLVKKKKVVQDFRKPSVSFSDLEIKVIEMICNEYTNKEIADKMSKSMRSIEGYRTEIMSKIGAKNTIGIVIYALQNDLVKLNKKYN